MGCCNKKRIKKIENFGYSESNVHFDQKIDVGNNLDNTDEFNKRRNSSKIAEEEFIEDKNSIKIGLDNIGAICYMNVTLQCLSNTKDINNYFLKKYKYKKNDENKKISNEFYIIIKNL
jgi:ubiquitin C-terminal hydrolase